MTIMQQPENLREMFKSTTPPQADGVCCFYKVLQSGFNTFLTAPRGGVLNPSARINAKTDKTNKNPAGSSRQKTGIVFSFSGFHEFRMGMGLFFGQLGSAGHHPAGDDFGLLFEYNFTDSVSYSRFYWHFTGGAGAVLLGVSLAIASGKDGTSAGFAPEIGIGLSTLFKIFYRYTFYLDRSYNSHEVVFHLCLSRGN